MQENVIIGVNILETLTTGMYSDSRVIFREYIQNSCDQIDKAIAEGLLTQKTGKIEIWIDENERSISIEDNATGINKKKFQEILYNIGESQKTLGKDKGFRGIGHWCGLGCCNKLVFTSKAKGENVESLMTCDAEKMRRMMIEHNTQKKRYTLNEVLSETICFSTNAQTDLNTHYFKVEMINITETNDHLLNLTEIKDYLSFVAPVPYPNTFIYRNEIYKHAKKLNVSIDEYNITVDGEPIVKKYTTHFETSKGRDDISGVDFEDFYDENGNLIGWLWYGLSKFIARINEDCIMRDIRLRKDNIQIGDATALKNISRRGDKIGTNYTVGEVFAVSKNLVPTSQRDYFEDNKERKIFEQHLNNFFTGTLYHLYHRGSDFNSAYDKVDKHGQMVSDFEKKDVSGWVDKTQRDLELEKLKVSEKNKDDALKKIEKLKDRYGDDPNVQRIIKERESKKEILKIIKPSKKHDNAIDEKAKSVYAVDTQLSHYSKQERKLVARIFSIISNSVDTKTAEKIKVRILEDLK